MSEPTCILLVEDNPGDARLMREMLRQEADVVLCWVQSLGAALERLDGGGVAAVLLDLGLPDSDGLRTVTALHERAPEVPIVVLTGRDDESIALGAVDAGAQDYLVKGAVDARLVQRSLRYARDRMRAANALRLSEEQLQRSNRELRETTAQLVQSAKLTALGELAAGVGHELSQPLNGIAVVTQAALRYLRTSSPEELESQLREVLGMVDSMRGIIDHMRQFVRRSTECEHRELDLNVVVGRSLAFLERQFAAQGVVIDRDLAAGLPGVCGDAPRLEQVFLNLLMNARAAIEDCPPERKRLCVRTYARELPGGRPGVAIEIHDAGVGICAALVPRLFESFFTTKAEGKGTGLGLSISKKIIDEHQGSIEVESEPDVGTTFRVLLPTSGPPAILRA